MQTIATESLQVTYNIYSITVLTPHLKFMVYRQNDGTIHFSAMTQLSQLSSVCFSVSPLLSSSCP